MILCVSPSPALDVTYRVDRLREHTTNRAHAVSARAGGKAVNVARVLHALGEPVTVLAPVGGATGEQVAADLGAAGISAVLVADPAETRRTVTIVSDESGDATIVNEPGALGDWPALLGRAEDLLDGVSLVVMSGSLPSGAPADAFAQVVRAAATRGVRTVVDTSGPALASALAAGPALVKPNLLELRAVSPHQDPARAAAELADATGCAVVVSLGPEGLVAAAAGDVWRARCARQLRGNPVGAGDAVVAALARGLSSGADWPAMLADAVALSGAAVLAPYAGEFSAHDYAALSGTVPVEWLGARA